MRIYGKSVVEAGELLVEGAVDLAYAARLAIAAVVVGEQGGELNETE